MNKNGKVLTNKQTKFIAEYLQSFNATKAAIKAGYSNKTAQVQGSRLLSNVMVREKINVEMDEYFHSQKRMLIHAADIAIKALIEIVENGKGIARVNAANSILDRAGHKPLSKIGATVSQEVDAEVTVEDARQELLEKFNRAFPIEPMNS